MVNWPLFATAPGVTIVTVIVFVVFVVAVAGKLKCFHMWGGANITVDSDDLCASFSSKKWSFMILCTRAGLSLCDR